MVKNKTRYALIVWRKNEKLLLPVVNGKFVKSGLLIHNSTSIKGKILHLFLRSHISLKILELLSLIRYEEAKINLEKAYSIYPYGPHISNNLAVLYWELGDREKSLHFITLAYKLDPDDKYIKFNRDVILGKVKGELRLIYH